MVMRKIKVTINMPTIVPFPVLKPDEEPEEEEDTASVGWVAPISAGGAVAVVSHLTMTLGV
ncbi:hypothetical protein FRB98_006485, partial [Tulasnella sp. 332]